MTKSHLINGTTLNLDISAFNNYLSQRKFFQFNWQLLIGSSVFLKIILISISGSSKSFLSGLFSSQYWHLCIRYILIIIDIFLSWCLWFFHIYVVSKKQTAYASSILPQHVTYVLFHCLSLEHACIYDTKFIEIFQRLFCNCFEMFEYYSDQCNILYSNSYTIRVNNDVFNV